MSEDSSLPPHLSLRVGGSSGGRARRARVPGGRLGTMLAALMSLGVLLFSVGGWSVSAYAEHNFRRVDLGLGRDHSSADHDVANYLLVGNDSRDGTNGEFGDEPGQHSDSTILMHVAEDGTATMVSFPRDTLVTIPEYTDADGRTHGQHRGKFNGAFHDGGPELLVKMVEKLTGMQIDHYVAIDLAGFMKITDAIGGVDVCVLPSTYRDGFEDDDGNWRVSTNTDDSMTGWRGGPGTLHVNGRQALAFVRQRHGFFEGDLARIARQQQFLGAVFHKATSSDILTNPLRLAALVDAATGAVTLDEGTSLDNLKDLALSMKDAGGMHVLTLPTRSPGLADGGNPENGTLPPFGSVKLYDPADLARIVVPMGGHVDGVASEDTTVPGAPGAGATPGPVTVPPAQVTVSVLNGSPTAGLATKVTTVLAAKGFHAVNARNADSTEYTTSRVLYGPGQQQAAWTVQAAVPGSVTRADPSITGIHLILGSGYTGVVTPTMTTATPTAAAPTARAPVTAPAATTTAAAPGPASPCTL
ncbi:transcriptional regulator [Parafrankia colletiae]|uniref:Transcriptional regulator n=1 Tax=Parafrankia colletiae TaxID=573497 RepID=A0A1S1QLG2_9ACTN|nr:LCP family protein [Parafrankia colletiae]MCK9899910.1 LCP family protein [Frankia sp. Cpl3]OHV34271.1 transcriptional regulator [Parafrankia colletiae]